MTWLESGQTVVSRRKVLTPRLNPGFNTAVYCAETVGAYGRSGARTLKPAFPFGAAAWGRAHEKSVAMSAGLTTSAAKAVGSENAPVRPFH